MDERTTLDEVFNALDLLDRRPVRSGEKIDSLCPAHDDTKPSLSVFIGRDGRVRVKCQTGCCRAKDIEGRIYDALGNSRPDSSALNSHAE